ncbi:MAG TPA: hypothetical protein VFV89_17625 [Nocardioides sp.]|nr:hypothetical protein [Nocardioides sp.]HEX5089632.1 hypothetical protein [Nocardioides sp.]
MDYFGFGQRSGNTGQQNFALFGRSCPQAVVERRLLPGTVESVGDLVEPVLEQVAVGVHGHGRRRMSEHLLDDLHVGSGGDRQARRSVPQLVRVKTRDPDRRSGGVEVPAAEDGRAQRRAAADPGEDELVGRQRLEVRRQLVNEEAWQRDLTPLVGLGCAPDQALALHDGDGLGDDGSATLEVDPARAQRRHLAEADTGVGEEEDSKAVRLVGPLGVRAVLARVRGVSALPS